MYNIIINMIIESINNIKNDINGIDNIYFYIKDIIDIFFLNFADTNTRVKYLQIINYIYLLHLSNNYDPIMEQCFKIYNIIIFKLYHYIIL